MWFRVTVKAVIKAFITFLEMVTVVGSQRLETNCECGVKNNDTLRFLPRGTFSENHAWPWMASIVNIMIPDNPVAYCGGTLINDRYILTAAHCIPDMLDTGIRNFRVYLGTNTISQGTNFLDMGIRKIISHHSFDYDSADNDACLIKLSEPVLYNNFISPVCLRQDEKHHVGEIGYITGWGSFNLTEATEDELKEAEAYIVSNDVCSQNYSSVDIPITDSMICASLPDEDDPCKGDSGGPLVLKENDVYTQIGIISHGQGCGVPNYPAIFSRVSSFVNWIKENTKDAVYCKGLMIGWVSWA